MRSILEIIEEVKKLQNIVTTLNERVASLETRQSPQTYIKSALFEPKREEPEGMPEESRSEKMKAYWRKRKNKG